MTGVDDESVTWSTDPPGAGFFKGNIYTAPGTYQDVNIIATSVEDPTLSGFANVEVANCSCQWNASFAGAHTANSSGEYAIRIEPQGFTFAPTESDLTPSINLITGPISGLGTSDVGVTLITASNEIWSQMDYEMPSPQLQVTSFTADENIEGIITGELHQLMSIGPPITYYRTNINMTFRAAFFDPFNPSNPCGCASTD